VQNAAFQVYWSKAAHGGHEEYGMKGESVPASTGNVVRAGPQRFEEDDDVSVSRFGFDKRLLTIEAEFFA
jgi:rRNA maturation protein Nop10